ARLYRRHSHRLGLRQSDPALETSLGRRGPDHARAVRRFRPVGDARNHPRRPHRLRAVLQPAALPRASGRDRATVEGRHVVPRRLSRLRARGRAVRASAQDPDPLARRRHLRGGADRNIPGPPRQFHQRRTVGPAERRAVGDGVPGRRAAAAPSEPALRGDARGLRAVRAAGAVGALRRVEAARPHPRRLRAVLWVRSLVQRILSRARSPARFPVGRPHHGHAALAADDPRRRTHHLARAARAGARPGMTPLEAEIRRMIAVDGPMSVATFMAVCLGHPAHGYYTARDPFGRAGDFITAPEISPMFGELIGLWAAAVWQMMGAPERLALVELGPGRGTLMADALRATRVVPTFAVALNIHLVETSPVLQRRQQQTLAGIEIPLAWHR